MAFVRTRYESPTVESGTLNRNYQGSVTVTTHSRNSRTWRGDDVIGSYDTDNALSLEWKIQSGGILSGYRRWTLPVERVDWNNIPLNLGPFTFPTPILNGSENQAKISALNASNPSRPIISLPTFIGELRDFPRMIRQAGRFLLAIRPTAKRIETLGTNHIRNWERANKNLVDPALSTAKVAASFNLAMQFGWAPLIGDLDKMVRFTESADKRRREIDSLFSGKGLKRRIKLENHVTTSGWSNHTYWSSNGTLLQSGGLANIRIDNSVERWATVRWRPKRRFPLPPSDAAVTSMFLGLTIPGLTLAAWELLPWSWLIDWFSNAGDLLRLSNNSLDAVPVSCCVMTHTIQTVKHHPQSWTFNSGGTHTGSLSFSGGQYVHEKKIRSVGLPTFTLEAKLPFLSGKQLSILGSLALLRGRGMTSP